MRAIFAIFSVVILAASSSRVAHAQPAPANDWPMESVTLKDGRTLKGLVQSAGDEGIEFVEIVRPQGRPMYAIVYPLAKSEVQKVTTLPPREHQRLARRYARFRHRSVIEAGRMQDLTLVRKGRTLIYRGPWFTVESTADDETTRRSIVRIDQVFRAFRLLLPPRADAKGELRVLLFGSRDEYQEHLTRLGLAIASPAYYSTTRNELAAGSDLSQYAAELAKVRARNEATLTEYRALGDMLPMRLGLLAEQMKQKGFTREQIKEEMQTRRAAWSAELAAVEKQVSDAGRRNDARFAEVTADMFRRLNHEAFHAYVENYVYPDDRGELPRWLNEGLAQMFERGQLEDDALRVDAPDAERLARLQADLADNPLPLRDLLSADAQTYLRDHHAETANRHYLYAWGLAYYLAFSEDLLGSRRLAEYAVTTGESDPIARFEKLIDRPLDKFEPQWRAAMRELKTPK